MTKSKKMFRYVRPGYREVFFKRVEGSREHKEFEDKVEFAFKNCKGRFITEKNGGLWYFEDPDDATLFKLTFG